MQLQKDARLFREAGFGLAAISYDSEAVLKEFAARKGIALPLLADHESTTIRAYGVADRRYRKGNQLDVDTEMVYTSSIGHVPVYGLAYPSVFLIGPDRTVLWRFVSESSEFRFSAAAVLSRSVGKDVRAASAAAAAKRVQVSATASDTRAGLGSRVLIGVDIVVPPGLHVYAPEAGGEYLGLAWTLGESKNCWTSAEPAWPDAARRKFEFSAAPLPVYEGSVRLRREIVVAPAISARNPQVYNSFRAVCLDEKQRLRVRGSLRVQACSERECYPPETAPLEWTFEFAPPDRTRSPIDLRREFEP